MSARDSFNTIFLTLRTALPFHLKGYISFRCKVGKRVSVVAYLTWKEVHLNQRIALLEAGETKKMKQGMFILMMSL